MLIPKSQLFELVRISALVFLIIVIGACAASRTVKYETVDVQRAETELPEVALLDVGIVIFDPGVEEFQEEVEDNVFPDIRRAEARYMPYHLKRTLETTGHWGSVWVLPEASAPVDVLVYGRVDRSDGLNAELRVGAWDSTGQEWLNKTYKTKVPEKAYSQYRDRTQDPYQNVYNEIANDLLATREKRSEKQLGNIRTVTEMRFAADLIPAAFDEHLEEKNGIYRIRRLPAEDDPMLQRMGAVREREYLLVDTLNEYYAGRYYELSQPYEDWR